MFNIFDVTPSKDIHTYVDNVSVDQFVDSLPPDPLLYERVINILDLIVKLDDPLMT